MKPSEVNYLKNSSKTLIYHLFNFFSESELEEDIPLNVNDHPYCFRFTWLGPKYDESNHFMNLTCKDQIKNAKGIPCVMPLVVTSKTNAITTLHCYNCNSKSW